MKLFYIRLLNMLLGVFLFALGIILVIRANIGAAPWDVLHTGIANSLGWSIGTASIVVGIVILIIIKFFGSELGLGTIANMLLIGVFVDIILKIDVIPKMSNIISASIMLITGLFAIAVGSYFYIKSGFGAGPRDSLMVLLVKKTKLPVGICRGMIELVVTITGWLLGGMIGIGTAMFVVGIGFCVQITFRFFKFDVTAVKHESLRDTFACLTGKSAN